MLKLARSHPEQNQSNTMPLRMVYPTVALGGYNSLVTSFHTQTIAWMIFLASPSQARVVLINLGDLLGIIKFLLRVFEGLGI